jgi:hypothetical protein
LKQSTINILSATRRNRALTAQQRRQLAHNLRRAKRCAGFLTVRWSDVLNCYVLWTACHIEPVTR